MKNLVPLALLCVWGAAFGAAAFGLHTPAFDDHPGQLARLHHVLTHGPAPWAWNADWWAGYPELQFYPPGFFYLGLLLHWASLGRLSAEGAYQALLWLAWLAPGLAAWWLLARRLGDGWLALPGAFVVLTLAADLPAGVEGGVHVGMLPARLGWAGLPLLALALRAPAAGPGGVATAAPAGALLALITLLHPAHLPAAVALVVAAAWAGGGAAGRRWTAVGGPLALGALLSAFWTLPLLARLGHTRALAWGEFTPLAMLVQHPLLGVLLLGALAAGRAAASPQERALAAWPWFAGAASLVLAVAQRFGVHWLPAHRALDGVVLAAALAAALAAGRALGALAGRRDFLRPALALLAILVVAAVGAPTGTLRLWPHAPDWPALEATRRGLRLDDLWATLRAAPPGRVLFLRAGVPLVFGDRWWRPHTHVLALTPLRSGRAIVNGTFTHPSPVAALLYRGSAGPGPITTLVERLDGVALFGRPLEALDPETFNAWADRLGISVVVGLDEDLPRLAALRDNPAFSPRPAVGPFVIWERPGGAAIPQPAGPRHWTLEVPPRPGAWVSARVAYYPLWRAEQDGRPLPTRPGPAGDLEARVDGRAGRLDLLYAALDPCGAAGALLTAATLAGLLATARRPGWRRPLGRPAAGGPAVTRDRSRG